MATFAQWLLAQEDEVDEGGRPTQTARLARAWKADTSRGNVSSPSGVRAWITNNWAGDPVDGRPDAATALAWLDHAHGVYRGQRSHLQAAPAQPAAQADLESLVRQIGHDIGWLKAAITLLLPDEALEVLAVAETAAEEPESHNWAEMWERADHSGPDQAS